MPGPLLQPLILVMATASAAGVPSAGMPDAVSAGSDPAPAVRILGDIDGDDDVDFEDLSILLLLWGHEFSAADLDGDGVVGFPDLVILLAHWT